MTWAKCAVPRTPVEVAADQVYEPDILFIRRDRWNILQRKGVTGTPDLVIEILSAGTAAYDRAPSSAVTSGLA